MPEDSTEAPSMRAVGFDHYGPPEGLELRDCPVPAPRPGEVRIRVRAASVNDSDWELLHGRPLVNRLAFGVRRPKLRALARKPADMTFEQAAAIPQAAMLAVQALIDTGQVAADRVFDFRQHDFTRAGERYHLIVDPRTDRSPFAYARALLPGGCYATVGGSMPRLLHNWLGGYLVGRRDGRRIRVVALAPNKDLDYLIECFEASSVVPVIDRVYGLSAAPAALRRFGSGLHVGTWAR